MATILFEGSLSLPPAGTPPSGPTLTLPGPSPAPQAISARFWQAPQTQPLAPSPGGPQGIAFAREHDARLASATPMPDGSLALFCATDRTDGWSGSVRVLAD